MSEINSKAKGRILLGRCQYVIGRSARVIAFFQVSGLEQGQRVGVLLDNPTGNHGNSNDYYTLWQDDTSGLLMVEENSTPSMRGTYRVLNNCSTSPAPQYVTMSLVVGSEKLPDLNPLELPEGFYLIDGSTLRCPLNDPALP